MLPTNQVLQRTDYWLQKAEADKRRTVYTLASRLKECSMQLKEYRYGTSDWEQERADKMKEEIGKLLHRLIEVLAEQDGEALQFCNWVDDLQEKERMLYRVSEEKQVHSSYYRYLASYVRQAAERIDLDEEMFQRVSRLVEQRPR